VTQVVPLPTDASVPLVADYHKAIKAVKADAEPGFVSLEGYMVGRLVIAALAKLDGEPSREALLKAMQSGTYDLGGMKLSFGANDNQGMDEVFLTIIQPGGSFKAVKSLNAGS
jgi:branched-chain amino acid transport system substrate-binding protein